MVPAIPSGTVPDLIVCLTGGYAVLCNKLRVPYGIEVLIKVQVGVGGGRGRNKVCT